MTTESDPVPQESIAEEPGQGGAPPEDAAPDGATPDSAAPDSATADSAAAETPAAGGGSLLGGEEMTAAEREYQAALRAAASLGLETQPVSEDEPEVDREAGELAARLGLDQPAPAPPEPEPASFFGEDEQAEADAEAEDEEDELPPDPGDGRHWYALNTYSGHESRVEKNLDRRIKSMDVADRIFRVVVPTEEELEIRGGQRRQVQRKLLPGYVLVEMILDDDTWTVVRDTPGVTGFVGTEHPVPMKPEEVRSILKQMKTGAAEPRVRVGFEIGDSVRVMEGPFADFMGEVDEILLEKGKVRVLISMFGRETPVELEFIQVEKV